MKKVEMYEAKNGKLCKTQIEAEIIDLKLRLEDCVKTLAEEDWRREQMELVFAYLIRSDKNLWKIARELCRIRRIDRILKQGEIPF